MWNYDFEELNIYFNIKAISYENGKYEQFNDGRDLLIYRSGLEYRENKYLSAISLYDKGKYEEALIKFRSMNSYKTSSDYIKYCQKKFKNKFWNNEKQK